MTSTLQRAMENNIPKIKMRTIPHPEIDEEIKTMMMEIKRIKILLMNNINYPRNKGKMLQLRKNIREMWKEKAGEMWSKLVEKTDKQKDPKEFWKDAGESKEDGGSKGH